jgi:hypothetical protein
MKQNFKQENSKLLATTFNCHYKGLWNHIIKSFYREFQKMHLFNEVH